MRIPATLLLLLVVACGNGERVNSSAHKNWFTVYQTDNTCQVVHPSHEDPFLKGPTGRAHPF